MQRTAHPSRAAFFLLLLALLAGGLSALAPQPRIVAAAPPSGWVKADRVRGGCDSAGRCNSDVTPGSPTLYEYRPDRQGVGRDYNVTNTQLAYHGGLPTFEHRERCNINGRDQYWSAGSWHHGGYWTLTYTASGGERWIGPSREHWAFYHSDSCDSDPAVDRTATAIARVPTSTPPGGELTPTTWRQDGTTTPTSPPVIPGTRTPAPTLTPFPTATEVPPCFAEQALPTGMGIDAVQGSTTVNYRSPVGYYVYPSYYPDQPPGLYDDDEPPPWPQDRAMAPIAAGQPLTVRYHLSSVSMNNPKENPLEPFTQWGAAKMFMWIKDLGVDLASSADDRYLFNLGSDAIGREDVESGNTIVQVQRWELADGVEVLGPQEFSNFDWGAGQWWEKLHSHDPGRGDYAPADDQHWPGTTPILNGSIQRVYVRHPDTMGFRFVPEPGHSYEVMSRVNKSSCSYWQSNYRLMRLTTVEPIDIGISMSVPRITTPGSAITYRLTYENTTTEPGKPFTLTHTLPDGVTFQDSSRQPTHQRGNTLTWDLPALYGRDDPQGRVWRGEIIVTATVVQGAPETLLTVATVAMPDDSNPTNNRAEGSTRVVYLPAPQATFRLRIHSDLDPQHGIYTSSGTAVKWPANEVMDFMPAITLGTPAQPADGAYRVTHRIVAWSLTQVGNTPIRAPACKAGAAPSGSDTAGAELGGLEGCHYRYISNPTVADMRGMAHSYWSETLPGSMRSDVYVWTPLPRGPTQLVLAYAVLTTAQENGVDVDGDGRTNSIIARTTTVTGGAFQVTLLAPRSRR
ncbi:MAG TPA: hypothetical protein VNL77_13925 [Roseiflexaceae bacterium]|nr:hypothetical protein [Roseiflexaceae bacterium]